MNVDGLIGNSTYTGKEFENIEILARDSMYFS